MTCSARPWRWPSGRRGAPNTDSPRPSAPAQTPGKEVASLVSCLGWSACAVRCACASAGRPLNGIPGGGAGSATGRRRSASRSRSAAGVRASSASRGGCRGAVISRRRFGTTAGACLLDVRHSRPVTDELQPGLRAGGMQMRGCAQPVTFRRRRQPPPRRRDAGDGLAAQAEGGNAVGITCSASGMISMTVGRSARSGRRSGSWTACRSLSTFRMALSPPVRRSAVSYPGTCKRGVPGRRVGKA